jgi:cardiolipin synthase
MLVFLASFSYLDQLAIPGIRFYRYGPGFLHQKVMLVDDELAMVGTANADNRSFRLNFEISIVVYGVEFAKEVEWMLKEDFTSCREAGADDYRKAHPGFRLAVRVARLLSPIL